MNTAGALTLPAAAAAENAGRLPGVKSREASRIVDDLMAAPIVARRAALRELEARDWTFVLNEASRSLGTPYGLWHDTPSGFVEDVCGDTIWSLQRDIIDALPNHKRVVVPAGMGVGKCLRRTERLPLADGRMPQVQDLVGQEFEVMAWQEDGTQVRRTARAAWNQLEPLVRVRTHSGREVVRNAEHPLWSAAVTRKMKGATSVTLIPEVRGWTPAGRLQVGDLLLVPERHHAQGERRAKPDHPELLGYLLGDGGTTRYVGFSQEPGPALDEFTAIVERLGGVMVKGHRRVDWSVRAPQRGQRNPVLDLVRDWGLFGVKAVDKRLPGWAWELPNDQLGAVMGRLFACDGSVYCARQGGNRLMARVSITLGSEQLVRDIEAAMLRLGVWGYVRHRRVKYAGGHREAWEWSCRDREALLRLAEVLDMPGKNEQMQALVQAVAAHPYRAANLWPHRNAPAGYRWEKVAQVEPLPAEMTVAVEVEGEHTFVTSLVEHNTFIAARVVGWAVCTRPIGSMVVVTTATRFRQVRYQLWPHIRKMVAKAALPGETDTTQWRVPDAYGNEVTVAYGFTAPANDEAAMQGIHGTPSLVLVVDEAGGIARPVGNGTNNLLTGDARMLAIGNPAMNDPRSWFEVLCEEGEDPDIPGTITIPIATTDSPGITGELTPVCRDCSPNFDGHTVTTHLPDKDWVDRTLREYGPDHPYVIAKVHAKFPRGVGNHIIPITWVEAAQERPDPSGPDFVKLSALGLPGETEDLVVRRGSWVRLGVDVAADGGDEFTIYRAVGDVIHHRHASAGSVNSNQVDVAEKVLEEIRAAERLAKALGSNARVRVKVDKNGLGQGVVGMLERWKGKRHHADIVGVMVSENPEREDEGAVMRPWRKRDEMWLAMRAMLQPDPSTGYGRLRLRLDAKAAVQLSLPNLENNASGYTVVESKKSLKRRGLKSPDRAEGALLAIYEPIPVGKRHKNRGLIH